MILTGTRSGRSFKVGDKVRLPLKPQKGFVGNVSWSHYEEMDEYCGLPATITKLYDDYAAYVDVDNGKWVWPFEWLTPTSRV